MRHSSLRHPIAVLRKIIEIAQPEFARLAGIAESTLAKIESLRLPLSTENAIKISSQTGISMSWLMAGDPLLPPLADEFRSPADGKKLVPFTQELFERCRAEIEDGDYPKIDVVAMLPLLELPAMAASARTLSQKRMFNYKVKKVFQDLAKEFPIHPTEMARRERQIFARKELELELVKSKGAVVNAMAQPVNEGIKILLQSLLDYGVALGHIRQNQWQTRNVIRTADRSNKKQSGRPRQRKRFKQKPKSHRRS
jgi:transcriptional regulator with XRE-family HTH domain